MRCRLSVTMNCQRMCTYCCNAQPHIKEAWQKMMLIDILHDGDKFGMGFDEIIITGGEPLLNWERTAYIVDQIDEYYDPKSVPIYLYTTMLIDEMPDVIEVFDGITWSLHHPMTRQDKIQFMDFQALIQFYPAKSFYLNIEQGIDDNLQLIPNRWDRVSTFKPLDPCPIPEGEQLYRLMEVFNVSNQIS